MPARHRHRHSSERRKSITITLESVFTFIWNPRSRCAGNRDHVGPEYAVTRFSPALCADRSASAGPNGRWIRSASLRADAGTVDGDRVAALAQATQESLSEGRVGEEVGPGGVREI